MFKVTAAEPTSVGRPFKLAQRGNPCRPKDPKNQPSEAFLAVACQNFEQFGISAIIGVAVRTRRPTRACVDPLIRMLLAGDARKGSGLFSGRQGADCQTALIYLGTNEAAEHAALVHSPRPTASDGRDIAVCSAWRREDQRSRLGGSDGLATRPWSRSKAIFSALSCFKSGGT